MPLRLKTRCRFRGCPHIVRGQFCDAHRGTYTGRNDRRRRTPAQRGYDRAWTRVANVRRQRDSYLCQMCLQADYLTPSKIVDHIIPVHVRPDWRLELGNTQGLCPPCHQRKTSEDTRRYGSSTTTNLTAEQQDHCRRAQLERHPPRVDDG